MDLFGTAGVRGPVDRVTPELVASVGRAAARHADDGAVFVVGRDGRTTGPALADAAAAGLQSGGGAVRRAGALPTPALAYASRGRRGVMLTASHNPPGDNGVKLFADGVEYDRDAEAAVADRLDDGPVAWDAWGDSERVSVLAEYRRAVTDYVADSFGRARGVRVAVDCGNGTASHATPQVLDALGAEVRALNATVDGHFPGRPSKPTERNLSDLRSFLARGDFDAGLAHDGDGDRLVLLDAEGDIVHEDTVVAVLAERYARASDAADPAVVTTPNASGRIDERVAAAGGHVERVRLGALHEGIADAEREGETVAFAAEPWKHLHPGFGGWIDGVVSAGALTALVAGEGLDALRAPVTERPYRKTPVDCPEDRKAAAMDHLREALPARLPDGEVTTEHGVRVAFPGGAWVLVRPSGTEPVIRVYAESDAVEDLLAEAVDAVEAAVERAGADR
jgi:phosphomannomutase